MAALTSLFPREEIADGLADGLNRPDIPVFNAVEQAMFVMEDGGAGNGFKFFARARSDLTRQYPDAAAIGREIGDDFQIA